MQFTLRTLLAASVACTALVSNLAVAGPLAGSTATIATDLGIGMGPGLSTCKSGDVVGAVGAGLELGAGSYTGSCGGLVTIDVADNQFTVGGVRQSDVGDYRWLTLMMDFVGAGPITGVSLMSQGLFRDDADNPTPVISFDADSISITWDSSGSGPTIFQLLDGGTAVFSVSTRESVPEPASLALVGIGLAAAALRRRTAR